MKAIETVNLTKKFGTLTAVDQVTSRWIRGNLRFTRPQWRW